ncbi:MAG TPA: HEAT repeat domain-containing protein [Pyrinomonadaceae bacterium]
MRRHAGAPAPHNPNAASAARLSRRVVAPFFLTLASALAAAVSGPPARAQRELTPLQHEVRVQSARLSSAEVEERRDAVERLGAMARPEGSRAAAAALGDSAAVVRATAARAVLSLASGEAAALILPLLRDRDEFVRREAAYALGVARSPLGVQPLAAAVQTDKQPSVRGAAAVALGRLGDAGAVPALAGALTRRLRASGFFNRLLRRKVEEDEFVRRAAAVSLGQIGSREAVPVLVEALSDARAPGDVRREAARALGLIGDPAAVPALRSVLTDADPYLSRIAFESLRRLEPSAAASPAGGEL